MDRAGCIADLRDVLAYFRKALSARTAPEKCTPTATAAEPTLPSWVGEHFQRNQYQLLRLLWRGTEVPIPEIHHAIYGCKSGQEEALDKVKDRTNRKLAEINQPFEVAKRRGEVYVLLHVR